MSRPLRLEYAGAIYHVTSRGNRREEIYLDDGDRQKWLDLLSQGMRQLNGVYTQKVNRRHGRVGHVFQGRFKAILVEKNSYLMELSRYIVLNPVRVRRVNDVHDWPWSSYAAMIGAQPSPVWLETGWLLGQFSESRQLAITAYKDFVRTGIGLPTIWGKLRQQIYLGSDGFVEEMQNQLNTSSSDVDMKEVPRKQRRPAAKSLGWYEAHHEQRDDGMVSAYCSGDYTMKEIADWFGVHYATVSRAIKKAEDV
jgi:putative transposase